MRLYLNPVTLNFSFFLPHGCLSGGAPLYVPFPLSTLILFSYLWLAIAHSDEAIVDLSVLSQKIQGKTGIPGFRLPFGLSNMYAKRNTYPARRVSGLYRAIFTIYLCTHTFVVQRVHAQTTYNQENLAFCFQLCTVAHFVGLLLLPWFSSSLVFFPYSWFGGFFVSYVYYNIKRSNKSFQIDFGGMKEPVQLFLLFGGIGLALV